MENEVNLLELEIRLVQYLIRFVFVCVDFSGVLGFCGLLMELRPVSSGGNPFISLSDEV